MTMPFRLSAIAVLVSIVAVGNAFSETTTDRYGKELKIEPSHNFFARFGLLGLKMNNGHEAVRDVSGGVLERPADVNNVTNPPAGTRGYYCRNDNFDINGDPLPLCSADAAPDQYATIYGSRTEDTLFGKPGSANYAGTDVLGLPDDVRMRIADPLPGAIGTLGMYLDEDHKWALEAPVMALPFSVSIYGAGSFERVGKMATGKALGVIVFGHYYFGQKADKFRPSVSLAANYLIPFDLEATPELERWTGGVTKISSKGSLGWGWLVGGKYALNERWDLNFNVGQFKAKIDNTIVTYDTRFTKNSPIFAYWPGQLGVNLRQLRDGGGVLANQLQWMEAFRNSDPAYKVNGGANLGTFTRKQTQTLDPYVLLMTVGYNF
jgi:outer membrane protein W